MPREKCMFSNRACFVVRFLGTLSVAPRSRKDIVLFLLCLEYWIISDFALFKTESYVLLRLDPKYLGQMFRV